ncbi:hypothetical protein BGZ98_008857 [Dissophora globulifera]|nr:hypothetical protein BGZ98_008857 [Dissophora globulifera]
MLDLTAKELALEAMLESRLELISARLCTLSNDTRTLSTETNKLFDVIQAKFPRLFMLEDHLLRTQGKPGLSNVYLETESTSTSASASASPEPQQLPQPQLVPRRPAHMLTGSNSAAHVRSIGDNEIEEIKMGVRTLRRKFQAASAAVTTVGWWRHLKEKNDAAVSASATLTVEQPSVPAVPAIPTIPDSSYSPPSPPSPVIPMTPVTVIKPVTPVAPVTPVVPVVPMIGFNAAAAAIKANKAARDAAKLSVDTSIPTPPPISFSPQLTGKPGEVLSPKTMLSPTSASTKKRNTLTLQQIFTPPPSSSTSSVFSKPIQQRERANPSLGLCSPPMSPNSIAI